MAYTTRNTVNRLAGKQLHLNHVVSEQTKGGINLFSIYTLSDLGVLSNLIGSLSLANEHYSPPTE